jgi:hypothetical protein
MTSMGSVELTVPAAAYRVDATTGLGKADVGIANDPNGRYRLALRTGTGSLLVDQASPRLVTGRPAHTCHPALTCSAARE